MILRRYRNSLEANNRRLSTKEKRRRLLHELLEGRRLLTVGPELLGIDHNDGVLIQDGSIHHTAPNELTFRFDEGDMIDPTTLSAIKLTRSGFDGVFDNGNDVDINPGFLDLGQTSYTVIMRFAETLPDDLYRIDIDGTGSGALRNTAGGALGDNTNDGVDNGADFSLEFDLQLGAQVISVVPLPVKRDPATGKLSQVKNQVEVHFNNDALDVGKATNRAFYRLIDTQDKSILTPDSISYDPATNLAVLTFGSDLSDATYELQIGASEESNDAATDAVNLGTISQKSTAAVYDSPVQKDVDGNVVPTTIPDAGSVISSISVIDSFFISDLNVELNIDHEWGPDLRVFLQSPGGQRIELLRDLGSQVRGGQIYGVKYEDLNGDGLRDQDEPGLPGWTIFIDTNANGELDPGERSTVTDSEGRYSFLNLDLEQTYPLVEVPQALWRATSPMGGAASEFYSTDFSVGATQTLTITGNNVDSSTDGDFRLGFSGRSTAPIEFAGINDGAATAANIQAELSLLLDPGLAVSVTPVVIGTAVSGTEFTMDFTVAGVGTAIDHPALVVVDNQLSNGQLELSNAGTTSGFTSVGTNNLWHLSTGHGNLTGHTPQYSFYFGKDETASGGGTYVPDADGTLRSPEIDLTDLNITGPVTLKFSHLLNTEQFFDFAEVRVVADGVTTSLLRTDANTGGFAEVALDLSRFVGKRIQLEFNFQSDGVVQQEGWYVDDIRIELGRDSQSVFVGSGPQEQVRYNIDFGAAKVPSTGRDAFGYQAFLLGNSVYSESFESGVLGPEWTTNSSTPQGRIGVTNSLGSPAHSGSFHLAMDVDTDGINNLNEAILTVDLSGMQNAYLSFWQKQTNDEATTLPATFIGSADGDGVSISEDGVTWHTVTSPMATPANEYHQFVVNLSDAAEAANISLGPNFRIKFQQYDNFTIPTDGRMFDDIQISDGLADFQDITSTGQSILQQFVDVGFAKQLGGTGEDAIAAMTRDPGGNSYVAGSFQGTVEFDLMGPGSTTLTSAGGNEIFIAKYDSAGGLLWARSAGGVSSDVATSVAVDTNGNVFVSGSYSQTANFGGTNLTSNGSTDAFIWKLDGDGMTLWAKGFGGSAIDEATGVDVTANGDLVATGFFSGKVDFDPNAGIQELTSNGATDVFVLRLTSGGNLTWVRQIGGTGTDRGAEVHITDGGNITTTGAFSGTVDFNPGTAGNAVDNRTSQGSTDVFVQQMTAGGVYRWTQVTGSPLTDRGTDLASDSDNNVYVTGTSNGDILYGKIAADGSTAVFKQFGGAGTDIGEAVFVSSDGADIHLAGSFRGTVNFGGGDVVAAGGSDAFLMRLDEFGLFSNVSTFGGTLDDSAVGVEVEDTDSLLLAGNFRGDATFDVGSTPDVLLTSNGSSDGFLAKIATPVGVDDATHELTAADLNGFEFTFYGTTYTNLFISSNGLISFEAAYDNGANTDLLVSPAEPIIAAFWDDLRTGAAQSEAVFWEVLGTGSEQQLVVQWSNVRLVNANAAAIGPLDFEVVLSERDGSIQLNYRSVTGAQSVPFGPQQSIGTFVSGAQSAPKIVSDGSGNYIVTWFSPGQAADGFDKIYARRYDAAGTALGNEFELPTSESPDPNYSIAMNASGRFVVAWFDSISGYTGTLARVYGPSGTPVTNVIQVESSAAGNATYPTVGIDVAGNFAVAWDAPSAADADGVLVRRFNSAGQPLGVVDEIQRLGFLGTPVNGSTFTLIHSGVATASIAYTTNATRQAQNIQDALRALSNTGNQIQVIALQDRNEVQSLTLTEVPVVVDEVQTLTFTDGPTSGTFILDFGGVNTAAITFAGAGMGATTALNIQTALAAIPAIGAGNVVVAPVGMSDTQFTVTFTGALAGTDVVALLLNQNNLNQGTLNIAQTTNGTSGGSFTLKFVGVETTPIVLAGAATAANIQAALEALANIGAGNVTVTQVVGSSTEFRVTFVGALGNQDVSLLMLGQDNLDQGTLNIAEVTSGSARGRDFEVRFLGADGGIDQPQLTLGDTQDGVTHIDFSTVRDGASGEMLVNNQVTNVQQLPSLDMLSSGDFNISWDSDGQDGSSFGVYSKRYSANGEAIAPEVDEIQYLTLNGPPNANSRFRLRIGGPGGPTTGNITYVGPNSGSRTAAAIQTALRALTGYADVVVESTPLFGGSNEIQRLTFTAPLPASGTFRLSHRGAITAPITFAGNQVANAAVTAMNIQDALRALPNTAPDQITVVPLQDNQGNNIPFQFNVNFLGPVDGGINHPLMVMVNNQLNQGGLNITTVDDGGTLENGFTIRFGGDSGKRDIPLIELFGNTGGVTSITVDELVQGVNSEFQVNLETFDSQANSDMVVRPDGSFFIVWSSENQDGDGFGIFGKLFDANGDLLRDEFQINTVTEFDQITPRADVDANGNLVVVWTRVQAIDFGNGNFQDSPVGVFARRLGADGFALGDQFQVNTLPINAQELFGAVPNVYPTPDLTVKPDGSFVVAWRTNAGSGGIQAQRYAPNGNAVGGEEQLSQFGTRNQTGVEIARSSNGNYVVVWTDIPRDPDISAGVFAQVFDANHVAITGEIEVAEITTMDQEVATVDMDDNGNFVVAWVSTDEFTSSQADKTSHVYGRRFNADGTPAGSQFQISTDPSGDDVSSKPDLDMDPQSGEFVVVWNGGRYARKFNADGTSQTAQLETVNLVFGNADDPARVALDPNGEFTIAFSGLEGETSLFSTFLQRFDAAGSPLTDPVDITEGVDTWKADIVADSKGTITVVWATDYFGNNTLPEVQMQRFDRMLEPLTDIVTVNDDAATPGSGDGMRPRISLASDDSFVVTWADEPRVGGILAQRFGDDAGFIGSNVVVSAAADQELYPVVSAAAGGEFTVAWLDAFAGRNGIFTQAFTPDLASVGIKAAGVQNVGENVLQVWVDGSRTALVAANTSTLITLVPQAHGRLFAVDSGLDQLLELDSLSGAVTASYPLPAATGTDAGLAYASGTVFYLAGNSDQLYQIDPDNGGTVSAMTLAGVSASGLAGLAYLNGEVVVLDTAAGELIFIDPYREIEVRRLTPDVTIASGLVGGGARGSLFAIDSNSQIVELNADDGTVLNTLASPGTGLTGLALVDGVLLVSNDAGVVYQVDPDSGVLLGTLMVPSGIGALGADGNGGFARALGGDYQPFVSTILDDEATLSITEGVGPYTGRFRPIDPLSTFDQTNVRGSWRLEVQDTVAGNTGVLNSWRLLVNEAQDTAPDVARVGFIGDSSNMAAAPANDVDIYRFDVLVGGTINIQVQPEDGLDAAIRLFDGQGNELASVDAAGINGAEQLIFTAANSGVFFIGISSKGNTAYNAVDGSGATGGTTTGSYSMELRFSEALVLDDDNSSFDTATPIGVIGVGGQSIRAEIRSAPYTVPLPGAVEEPGHRDIPPESHYENLYASDYKQGEVILGFQEAVDAATRTALLNTMGLTPIRSLGLTGAILVRTQPGVDVIEKIAQLSQLEQIRYAEPNLIGSWDVIPNDTRFGEMWQLDNIGQTGGTVDADIDAPEAWDIFTGSAQTVIAIIDSGTDYNHPDLAANMWRNPGEVPGDGIDNDGNGYIDDVFGIDPAAGTSDPMDTFGHGTHVAGTTAAVGDNGQGITGINWNAKIMALAIGDSGPVLAAAIESVNYMTTMKTIYGINVVVSNNSYSLGYSQAFQDAIKASNDAGIMFVAAAGNSGIDIDSSPTYPASYPLEGIITVAATDQNDQLASFSNRGFNSVDIAAPGVNTLSTTLGGGYGTNSGTSMASPHVAGAVALLAGHRPGATLDQIKGALLLGGDALPQLTGTTVSGARLNLAQSLALIEAGVSGPLGSAVQTVYYNFQDIYGVLPSGADAVNAITENQKQRAREIFEFYSNLTGLEFVETVNEGLTVVTGDLRVISPTAPTGPGGVAGISSGSLSGMVIMDAAENWGNSEYGGGWFQTAMHEIGHSAGLGHTYDLPATTIMGDFGTGEPVFPGDNDIVHIQYLHNPASIDIDLYQFRVSEDGYVTAETIAERLAPNASLLDTSISIYRDLGNGNRELIATNDDYYSNDSYLRLHLQRGDYFVGVNASNNKQMDPAISDTGFGGTSQGDYELFLNFEPDGVSTIADTDGVALDGDADGNPGGTFRFFFESGPTIFVDKMADTGAGVQGDGSLAAPFDNIFSATELARSTLVMPRDGAANLSDGESFLISDGLNPPVTFEFDDNGFVTPGSLEVPFTATMNSQELAAAVAQAILDATTTDPVLLNVSVNIQGGLVRVGGTTLVDASGSPSLLQSPNLIRIVGNGGDDGDVNTLSDNRPYLLGLDGIQALADGASLQVPQGVTVMIDAGALFKLNEGNLDVGTSGEGVDRRAGALQVLGTPDAKVSFYSYHDDLVGGNSDGPGPAASPGDWGGMVFRADSDLEESGVFLSWVNQAEIVSGGGKLLVDSVESTFTPIHLIGARPTISHNIIRRSADAAISADPASFEESLGRVGPDIYGNLIVNNSINGLFVRIQTELGSVIDKITLPSRWDDVDITHVLTENLLVSATPGGPLKDAATGIINARLDGSLKIDPGVIVKMEGSRIEVELGGQLIAEGTAANGVVFTALTDDSYGGSSGTFDTKNDGNATVPGPGQWGGLFFSAMAQGSLDHVTLAYAGGQTPIEGTFDQFNAIEIHQAEVRIAHSVIRDNAAGTSSTDRNGRGTNAAATVFVRGAQPTIVENLFQDNAGAVIHINANSLQAVRHADPGRVTGELDRYEEFADNYGPLVWLNRLQNNGLNGMEVRGAVLTTESVWDDTDIAHVLRDEITLLNHHTFSGLHLLSSSVESLVIKLDGPNAGFTADGTPLDIDDRIGGSIYIGAQGLPVVLTSLADDTAIAGVNGVGQPLGDTNNDGSSTGSAGDWRGITLDHYSNDRNVGLVREAEPAFSGMADLNRVPEDAEFLGNLAPDEKSGDVNRRLGFEIYGNISVDNPHDVDVYSFSGVAGTEVFLDLDQTSASLDSILELVDATGTVLARSINSSASDLSGAAFPLLKYSYLGRDYYSTSDRDAGMRVILPGTPGRTGTYFVRVRSNPAEGDVENINGGLTRGEYKLQIRLRQIDEKPGSFITNADIRFATNAIEVLGLPAHSPLIGESYETRATNDTLGAAQPLGNLLTSDQNTVSVGGNLTSSTDVDWYSFTLDYDLIQAIGGFNAGGKTFATIFDIDYADGLSRPDTVLSVFDASGNLVLVSRDSNIEDDQPGAGQGADTDDLSRGSFGTLDAYIGSVQMPAGVVPAGGNTTYYVAVSSNSQLPTALNGTFSSAASSTLVRLEPINSIQRIAEDHIGFQGYISGNPSFGTLVTPTTQLFDIANSISLSTNVIPFTLNDIILYTAQGGTNGLKAANPYTGNLWYNVGNLPTTNPVTAIGDIAMRNDGRLFMVESLGGQAGQNTAGRLVELDPNTGVATVIGNDAIPDIDPNANPAVPDQLTSPGIDALAWQFTGFNGTTNNYNLYYSVQGGRRGPGVDLNSSSLYFADPSNGSAAPAQGQPWGLRGEIYQTSPGDLGRTTGMAFIGGTLYGVSDSGLFYQINTGSGRASNVVNLGAGAFSGLALGPQNAQGGAYANTLFASTQSGQLFAIDPAGFLLAVFQNGTSANTGTAPVGLAFSTLDFNLWHPTERRTADAGHGVNSTFDQSRDPSIWARDIGSDTDIRNTSEAEGGLSFYFGLETWESNPSGADAYIAYDGINAQYGVLNSNNHRAMSNNAIIGNNYNLPGGAQGSLQTQQVSLAGYDAADKPTLYFNYYLETQSQNSTTQMRDSARVLVSPNGGVTWELLATNNSVLSPVGFVNELPSFISPNVEASTHPRQQVQELFDNTGGWRQARVDLSNYAGVSQLLFRFDFSTAGAMTGPNGTTQPGDPSVSGSLTSNQRGLDNSFEGFYIDDVLIGFSERGEMVTNSGAQSTFFTIPQNPNLGDPGQVLVGNYQLEIRRGTEYGANVDSLNPDIYINQIFDTNDRLIPAFYRLGDQNHPRAQGQVLIAANTISDSLEYGIVVDAGARSASGSLSYPGGVRNLPTLNNQRLTAGVKLENNIVDTFGMGGILFSGDPNAGTTPLASVPFGRILNNTIYGGTSASGAGIQVTDNASPTILNNVIANTRTGLTVDASSSSTVLGANLFQGNTSNGSIGQNAIVLQPTDPLFVDAPNRNFYPAPGSLAIDSSLNSLADRPSFEAVNSPLGIPTSPILAPDRDRYGQLRLDDPDQDPPPGGGSDVFKDRGAVERADFRGPTARLIDPPDNDGLGLDLNPVANEVLVQPTIISQIVIQLQDQGIGISDTTVTANQVAVYLDGVLLTEGPDYEFIYNATNNQIVLRALANNGPVSNRYDIILSNAPATGIRDLADNALTSNKATGETSFVVITGGQAGGGTLPDFTLTTTMVSALEDNEKESGMTPTTVPGFATNLPPVGGVGDPVIVMATVSVSRPELFSQAPAVDQNGTLSFITAADQNGTAEVVIRLTETGVSNPRQSDPQTFTITLAAVNDAPNVSIPAQLDVLEDAGLVIIPGFAQDFGPGPVTAVDEVTQTVTVTTTALNPAFFQTQPTIDNMGTLRFQMIPDFNSTMGEVLVTVVAVDNGPTGAPNVNTSPTETFTINVQAVNDAPSFTLTQTAVTVDEDETEVTGLPRVEFPGFVTNLSVGPPTATDETGQTFSFTLASTAPELFEEQPAIDANGTLSFKSAPNRNGTAIVFVQMFDSGLATPPPNDNSSRTETFAISIRPVNDAPEFTVPASLVVQEDAGLVTRTLFATGIRPGPVDALDEVNQRVDFEVIALDPSAFAVQPQMTANGTLTFKTGLNVNSANADLRVRMRLFDSGPSGPLPNTNVSAFQTVNIMVNPVNDAPVPDSFNTTGAEDTSITIQAADILAGDKPGPTPDETEGLYMSQVETTTAKGGKVVPVFNAGEIVSLTYTPPLNYVGQDTFLYVVTDLGSPRMSGTGTVAITVTPVNDPPQFTVGANQIVEEDAGAVIVPGWATNILPGPPSALDERLTQTVAFKVTAANPALFAVQPAVAPNGTLTYTPAVDANGVSPVVLTAIDSGSGVAPNVNESLPQTFLITVQPVNDAPVFTAGGDVSVAEDSGPYQQPWATNIAAAGGLLANPPTATDESSQAISFVVSVDRPELFQVQPGVNSSGQLSFTPAKDANGVAVISVTAVDSGPSGGANQNTSQTKSLKITITGVNDPPIAIDDTYNTDENHILQVASPGLLSNDTDVDLPNDAIRAIAKTALSELGAIVVVSTDGSFSYDPRSVALIQQLSTGQSVSDSFVYEIQDLAGAKSPPATVTINVAGIDDPPIANGDTFSIGVGESRALNVLTNDVDNDSLIDPTSVEITSIPITGTATVLPNGEIQYSAGPGSAGMDTLGYTVRDIAGNLSNEAFVKVIINSAPEASADFAFTFKNTSVDINVLANDSDFDGTLDPNSVVVVVAPTPSGSTQVLSGGIVRFTPGEDFSGTAQFSYVVSDNVGTVSNVAVVSVDVQNSRWQNPQGSLDVNADGSISPIDALLIVNYLNSGAETYLPDSGITSPPYLDPTGDENVTPLDVLTVVNFLNQSSNGGGAEGEATLDRASTFVMPLTPQQVTQAVADQQARRMRSALDESIVNAFDDELSLVGRAPVFGPIRPQAAQPVDLHGDDELLHTLSSSRDESAGESLEQIVDELFNNDLF